MDPTVIFSHLQRFSQPSEVWVPTELLRSGAVLHARGLINSQAIQHNLDWVWPMWVERQFNPMDKAFIPRAFSLTHINLTHRNWTAIGVPDFPNFPIVDPHGLVTPFYDGWSMDAWIVGENFSLLPSRVFEIEQGLDLYNTLAVLTYAQLGSLILHSRSEVKVENDIPVCEIIYRAVSPSKGWLAVCPRPYNPEGVSFIHSIERLSEAPGWTINEKQRVNLSENPFCYLFSNYSSGDIYSRILSFNAFEHVPDKEAVSCSVGMASAAALYRLEPHQPKEITVKIPLVKARLGSYAPWSDHLETQCRLKIPDEKFESLYKAALKTLILHTPEEVYAGPFTYKRFWFRDTAFILYAMIATGLLKNMEKILDHFPRHQRATGYFMSQDGEWDSNGQAIWILQRFAAMTNTKIKHEWLSSVYHAARWIQWKRLPSKHKELHSGLMPSGFSAEHFGPSDFYYWDNFWCAAGLRAASTLAAQESPDLSKKFREGADDLMHSIEESLAAVQKRLKYMGVPASPYRRMDGGAIGSLAASYPLQLWSAEDKRTMQTVEFLVRKYFLDGAFYHEISHSGINTYLSLHVAQVMLRAGDERFYDIVKFIADLASPTGQWPEAIHPLTKGGCMGDGQHIWAAAEWVLMMRNMFVREEENNRTLILCSGIPEKWIKEGEALFFGPTLTVFGKVSVSIKVDEFVRVSWDGQWYGEPPVVEIDLPGYPRQVIKDNVNTVRMRSNAIIQ